MEVSASTLEGIKQIFHKYDTDNDGQLTPLELVDAMKCLKLDVSYDAAQSMVRKHDKNSNGTLQLDEFTAMMVNYIRVSQAFKCVDKDGDGVITKAEFKAHLQGKGVNLSEEELEDIMRDADTDGNKEINIGEFAAFLEKIRQEEQE